MILSAYVFLSAVVALWIGLAFLRIRGIRAVVHVLITGAVCFAVYQWLKAANQTEYFFWWEMGLICLSALSVRLWLRCRWGEVAHIFLLAQSALGAFWLPMNAWNVPGWTNAGLGMILLAAFVILTLTLRKRFPGRDWQDNFQANITDGSANPRIQHMYIIPVVLCVMLAAVCQLLRLDSLPGCILTCLMATAVFWLAVWLMAQMSDYEKERSTLLAEQQYRGEMQSFLNVIRSQRHDYNFHVQTIAGLIRQNKMEDCLRYINALEEDVAIMNAVLPIRDPAISAMIHNFRLMAVRQGTELHVDIHYDLSQIATNVYETNKIISNLLQNAIDEVSTHEDKSHGIWLTILKRGEYCVIRVTNKLKERLSQEDLENIYRQGYTTKQGHEGVGLSSLRTLIGRYRGVLYTQVEEDEIQFIARVPINYAKEPIEE